MTHTPHLPRRVTGALAVAAVALGLGLTAGTASSASAATPATVRPASQTALSALSSLPVKALASSSGYSRDQFGTAWTDAQDAPGGRNGCDTRNDVLRRDLTKQVVDTDGCTVESGHLTDPYAGKSINFVRGVGTSSAVQIDHIVALSDAWQTGAQSLTKTVRTQLANDPLNLWAVDGPTNDAKGDKDAASWLPPHTASDCMYVARQVAVKIAYHLWVTKAEHDAIASVLGGCSTLALPTEANWAVPNPS
ncbi:MAG TPA: HNH endonuclease family protein [Jatrophihabitans sp.]|nr:HNH endonuclease family protein [Jatrophihabitans sp.]